MGKLRDFGLDVCTRTQNCMEETYSSWLRTENAASVGSPADPYGSHLSSSPWCPGEVGRLIPSLSRTRGGSGSSSRPRNSPHPPASGEAQKGPQPTSVHPPVKMRLPTGLRPVSAGSGHLRSGSSRGDSEFGLRGESQ